MKKILVTGATGQFGSDLVKILSNEYQIIPVSRNNFDITDFEATRRFIIKHEPDIIIHTAAFTNVDACEKEQDKAFKVNGLGTRNIAIAARKIGANMVYISTDYVFDGAKEESYREYDKPNPINIYGESKLLGEEFVKEQLNSFFIIRTAWLYGTTGNNFVKTMLKLAHGRDEIKVVNDQCGTPTYSKDLAKQIEKLIQTEFYGTYHCTSQGSCSWYEFALEIFKAIGYEITEPQTQNSEPCTLTPKIQDLRPITVKPVSTEEFPRPAKRPKNSILENYMLKLQGLDCMPPWEKSLKRFMEMFEPQHKLEAKMEETL